MWIFIGMLTLPVLAAYGYLYFRFAQKSAASIQAAIDRDWFQGLANPGEAIEPQASSSKAGGSRAEAEMAQTGVGSVVTSIEDSTVSLSD